MRSIRIIPRLDIKGPNLVKGIHLEGLRVLGLPERFSSTYFQDNADELLYIDSVASLYGRNNLEGIVKKTAENVFIPITVGGGIRTIEDIRNLLRVGADKIAINTGAVANPKLITEGAKVFGSQCIVVSVQAIRLGNGKYEAYTDNGREPTGLDVIEWVTQAVDRGAGEVLITSIDQEGTGDGYDIELVSQIVDSVNVPVIACGGAGGIKHVEELIKNCDVDAICAASFFHYHVLKQFGVEKREEGNVDYLKRFVESDYPILKRIEPASVSELQNHLMTTKACDIKKTPIRDFTSERKKIRDRITQRTCKTIQDIVIVDYGRSNLFSVAHAFEKIGVVAKISNDPMKIKKVDKLILAGVGAFGDGLKGLQENGLFDPIQEFVDKGKPILGICLGMQLFMSESEEFGKHHGLDLIKGKVKKLNALDVNQQKLKIPHIGWNQIEHNTSKESDPSVILKNISQGESVYFIHSYVVSPEDGNCVVANTKYGQNTFCSVVAEGNVFGCQFHPERSGIAGLKIYQNFITEV